MNGDVLAKYLTRYFKQPEVDRGNLAKVFDHIEEFSANNMQVQMIQKIFKVAESVMSKDNLKVIIKRYLHIINQILEKDDNLLPQYKYNNAISNEIVPEFISMLRNVLNYGPMDLLGDLKLYRKRWAKRITDQAYTALQNQAQRQLKVDLDRGFHDDIIKKLTKSYQKRQFSKAELERYLPTSSGLASSETRKSSAVHSSSSQQDKKRRKQDRKASQSQERVAEKRNDYSSDLVMSRHSFIPSFSNSFGNGFVGDPRRPNQILHRPLQSIYPPYEMPNRVINPSVGELNPYFNPVQNYFQPVNYPNYGYQNFNNYPQNYQGYQNMPYEMPAQPEQNYDKYDVPPKQTQSKHSKLFHKMEMFKKNWFYECKCCGLLISTGQKYEEHMMQHFQQAQKSYEIAHSRADHSRKGNKPLMPSLQGWIHSKRVKLSDQKFQVSIEDQCTRNEICLICKAELKVQWSDEHESWVYEDAIRVKTKNTNSICHAQCYHTVHDFERSSEESK